MPTIKECLECSSLLESVSDSARLDVELLLSYVIKKDRSYLFGFSEKKLTQEQYECFLLLLKSRKTGKPMAYLLGRKEFWSLPFFVNESTLIPRPDTETLVESALNIAKMIVNDVEVNYSLLDLGTGTGAIAIAFSKQQAITHSKESPRWHITAVDNNADAIALCEKNIALNQVENITVIKSDWFSGVKEKFHIIVSNPPYIDAADMHLQLGDVRFEPASALISEDKGLADIKKIIATSQNFLLPNGCLLIEHGWQQGEKVREVFSARNFVQIKTIKDLSGNERVTFGFTNE